MTSLIAWVNIIISIGITIVLFRLGDSNKRYSKAAVFRVIVVVLSILSNIYLVGSILVSILSSALAIALSPMFLQYATVIVGIVIVLAGGFDKKINKNVLHIWESSNICVIVSYHRSEIIRTKIRKCKYAKI